MQFFYFLPSPTLKFCIVLNVIKITSKQRKWKNLENTGVTCVTSIFDHNKRMSLPTPNVDQPYASTSNPCKKTAKYTKHKQTNKITKRNILQIKLR